MIPFVGWVGQASCRRLEEPVYPELKVMRHGRLVVIPLRELERRTEANAETT